MAAHLHAHRSLGVENRIVPTRALNWADMGAVQGGQESDTMSSRFWTLPPGVHAVLIDSEDQLDSFRHAGGGNGGQRGRRRWRSERAAAGGGGVQGGAAKLNAFPPSLLRAVTC